MNLKEPPRKGHFARLLRSLVFQAACGLIIITDICVTVYITNYEVAHIVSAETALVFAIMEFCFILLYSCELFLRLHVHGKFFFCNKDMQWNIFDLLLVCLALSDMLFNATSISSITFLRSLRILRLAKVFRGVRVMRFLSELRVVLNALLSSLTSLFWGMIMMALIFYVFAIIFVQTATASGAGPGGGDSLD